MQLYQKHLATFQGTTKGTILGQSSVCTRHWMCSLCEFPICRDSSKESWPSWTKLCSAYLGQRGDGLCRSRCHGFGTQGKATCLQRIASSPRLPSWHSLGSFCRPAAGLSMDQWSSMDNHDLRAMRYGPRCPLASESYVEAAPAHGANILNTPARTATGL